MKWAMPRYRHEHHVLKYSLLNIYQFLGAVDVTLSRSFGRSPVDHDVCGRPSAWMGTRQETANGRCAASAFFRDGKALKPAHRGRTSVARLRPNGRYLRETGRGHVAELWNNRWIRRTGPFRATFLFHWTRIQVGVNSSKAPSIVIQFQGNPGQQYYVQVINGNSMVENISVVGQQNTGLVDVTYNPAIMPLDPIFNLYTPSSPTPTPIPVPPPVKQPFDYTKFIVISGGLLAIIALAYYYGKSNKGRSGGYGGRRI